MCGGVVVCVCVGVVVYIFRSSFMNQHNECYSALPRHPGFQPFNWGRLPRLPVTCNDHVLVWSLGCPDSPEVHHVHVVLQLL